MSQLDRLHQDLAQRSLSAPPVASQVEGAEGGYGEGNGPDYDFRRDPEYHQFFSQNRMLNPRLPRPLRDGGYHPGYRAIGSSLGGAEDVEGAQGPDGAGGPYDPRPKSLNDRIQEDFPRTPSRALHGEASPDKVAPTTTSEQLERELLSLSLADQAAEASGQRVPAPVQPMNVGVEHPAGGFLPGPSGPTGSQTSARSHPTQHQPARPMEHREPPLPTSAGYPLHPRMEGYDPQHPQQPQPQYDEGMLQYARGLEGFGGGVYPGAQVLAPGYPGSVGVPMAPMPAYFSTGFQGLNPRMHPDTMRGMAAPGGVPGYPQPMAMGSEFTGAIPMQGGPFQSHWDPARAQQPPQGRHGRWDNKDRKQDRRSRRGGHSMQGHRGMGGSSQVSQSPVVSSFRDALEKGEKPRLGDLAGKLCDLARDQHGSRYIQQALEAATPAEKDTVFQELYADAFNLMQDVFGNYCIQKFFEHGSEEQKKSLVDLMRNRVRDLSVQMYGCRVVQRALQYSDMKTRDELIGEIRDGILSIVEDQNGNHVVQKVIELLQDPEALQFIVDALKPNVFAIATHPYGCRVVQRLIQSCSSGQKHELLDQLNSKWETLMKDQYGNYVVQHVMVHGRPAHQDGIIRTVADHLQDLSQHKYSSNVVESCLNHADQEGRNAIGLAMLREENDTPVLLSIVKDPFGNFVVQKALNVVSTQVRDRLFDVIRASAPQLRRFNYAKHVLMRLDEEDGGNPSSGGNTGNRGGRGRGRGGSGRRGDGGASQGGVGGRGGHRGHRGGKRGGDHMMPMDRAGRAEYATGQPGHFDMATRGAPSGPPTGAYFPAHGAYVAAGMPSAQLASATAPGGSPTSESTFAFNPTIPGAPQGPGGSSQQMSEQKHWYQFF